MSSIMCQDMQPNLENQHIEQRMSKLTPSNSNIFQSLPMHQEPNLSQDLDHNENIKTEENNSSSGEQHMGGFNFIQELTHTSKTKIQCTETDQEVYVHPLVKRSSSTLSMKSLEMCTESLGSETGSNMSDNCDDFSVTVMEKQNRHGVEGSKSRDFYRKVDRVVNFPPPLTSMSCSDGVKVRPRREGGRLVLTAETVSSSNSPYFQAERVDGRLRLSFLKNYNLKYANDLAETEKNVRIDEDCEEASENGYDNDIEEDYCVDGSEENDAEEEDDEDDADGVSLRKNGCEIEVGDFPRPSRCKEDGNGRKRMQIGRHFGCLFPEGYALQLKV